MSNRDKAQTTSVIAAVSGGVDSIVMLHSLLSTERSGKVVVAHFDHGIRDDSAADARFVAGLARQYDLEFELGQGHLPANVGEEEARDARYKFLARVAKKYSANQIAMAHHRDDIIETVIINILRGTGRRGMSSLKNTDIYSRPLLNWTKQQVYDFALEHHLEWVEDPTNSSDQYLRNRIRHRLVPLLRQKRLLAHLGELVDWFYRQNPVLDEWVGAVFSETIEETRDHTALPVKSLADRVIASELLVAILNKFKVEVDQPEITRLMDFAENGREGAVFNQFPPLRISKQADWLLFDNDTASRD